MADDLGRFVIHQMYSFHNVIIQVIVKLGWNIKSCSLIALSLLQYLLLKGQYHNDQSRLSTGYGIGVLVR